MNLRTLAPAALLAALLAALALAGCAKRELTLTEEQKAAVRQEVLQAMKPIWAAAERMDPVIENICLEHPDFAYATPDGKVLPFPEFKKLCAEMAPQFSSQKFVIRGEKVIILAPDAALHCWQGGNDMVQKNGSVLRADPFAGTYLLRKVGATWKAAYLHESSLPMAIVTGAVAVKDVYKGEKIDKHHRFTDARIRRDDRWQCVSANGTTILKP